MNLNQITVPSLDVAKAIDFYQKLGLHLIVEALPHYARFMCKDGVSTFSIHQAEKLPEGEGVIVYFEDDNLDRTINEFVEKGIIIDELPNDKNWLWREARLKDLDGNQLIIYYAGENRLNPPWRIN
jgi:catechol 2,3-dioxygenase-like lactoylglutathione lyase family enzyme